ncbi:hypothetical protein FBU31_004565, partial [Coemansia sp. 'formosensis']
MDQQDISGLFLKDFDGSGEGTFPFPLGDQASSLFNFHTPAGLGLGPLYLNNDSLGFGMGQSQLLNSVLYDMSGIQQIDGLHHGTQIATDDMSLFLAAAAADELSHHQPSASMVAGRIDQACRMCRRRKVKCDGLRPACTFCRTKAFECAYEPPAPAGSRKRQRRHQQQQNAGSESHTEMSSAASLAAAAADAGAAA